MTPEQITDYLFTLREAEDVDLPLSPLVTEAWDSIPPQRVGVVHLLARPRFVLGDDVGGGKTCQTLVAFAHLRQRAPQTRLLVLCPVSVLHQWATAAEQFTAIRGVEVLGAERLPKGRVRQHGADYRREQYGRFGRGETAVLIASYGSILQDFKVTTPPKPGERRRGHYWAWPADWAPFVLALDECHALRNDGGTVVYPGLCSLIAISQYAWGLSATLISNRAMDVFNIFNALRPGLLGTRKRFEQLYLRRRLHKIFVRGQRGQTRNVWKVEGSQNLDQLAREIRPWVLRRTADKFGKYMPGIRISIREVPLAADQMKLYRRAAKAKLLAGEDTGYRTAQRLAALAAYGDELTISKSSVVCYAQLAVDAPTVLGFPETSSAKLDELTRLLDGELSGSQVLIFSRFAQVADYVTASLRKSGIPTGLITGAVAASKRRETQLAFQDGQLRALTLTSSGREGLDLQAASVVVFYDLPWSWMEFIQVMGRARRIGSQHAQVRVILLGTTTTKGTATIDTATFELLKRKSVISSDVFGLTVSEEQFAALASTTSVAAAVAEDTPVEALSQSDLAFLFEAVTDGAETP